MSEELKQAALEYHEHPKPGKIAIQLTKPTNTRRDLSLAYSPGVASPVKAIQQDPNLAYAYTSKGNLVGVITDGSAVLGLGNVGAIAGKPVMEGKAVLFKRFADIDVFDIEINATTSKDFVDTVIRIADTFGGINLEDIAAPRCFEIEESLLRKLNIPVFHDDQHGTAIVIGAALLNALELQGKKIQDVKVVCLGAGAAGVASMKMLMALGATPENLFMAGRKGVLHTGRTDLDKWRKPFARNTNAHTLEAICADADVFIGVAGPDLLSVDAVRSMAPKAIIFALANPDPEITPELIRTVRDDIIIATGRSDYPNQVNNVLCFPFLFRGALNVYASSINQAMQVAAVHALAQLAKEPVPEEIQKIYGMDSMAFGPDYIIPTPFDPRLIERIPTAVSEAAIATGVARKID